MYKQVIVVNREILKKIGKGKLAAQVAHASHFSLREALKRRPSIVYAWESSGAKKVVLKASRDEILVIYERARARGIPAALIHDAGHTQLPSGTLTALGLGPAPEKILDELTGHLKLL